MPGIYPIRPDVQIDFAFHVQLRTYREAAGLSLSDLAEELSDCLAEKYVANDLRDMEEGVLDPPAQTHFYFALFQILELGIRESGEMVRTVENQLGVELSDDALSLESLAMIEDRVEYPDEEE